jgi:hypothetical protein
MVEAMDLGFWLGAWGSPLYEMALACGVVLIAIAVPCVLVRIYSLGLWWCYLGKNVRK